MSKLLVKHASFHKWVRFVVMALVVALLLAFRPVPSILSSNDTGRYVVELEEYCSTGQITDTEGIFRESGYSLMYTITGSCLFGSYRLFLFLAAMTVPASYLCFSSWKRGDGLIASSAMFSVVGIEFMSNALRNGFAVFFFLGALKIGQKTLVLSAALFAFAVVLHSSIFVFLPVLFYVWFRSANRWQVGLVALTVMTMVGLQVIFDPSGFEDAISSVFDLGANYSLIYDLGANGMFTLFMVAPLVAIFLLRVGLDRSKVTALELFCFIYSSLLIIFNFAVFPFVTFRFAMIGIALQLFAITLSGSQSMNANRLIFCTLSSHLVIMLFASSNYSNFWQ